MTASPTAGRAGTTDECPDQDDDSEKADGPDEADRGNRMVLAVLVLGGLMATLDVTIINVAIRTLSAELDASLPVIQWVTTGYTLALASVVPTTAWLVGRLGTRRVYILALNLFVLGSVLCGLAWNVGSLVAFRVIQGIGGGLVNPVAMTIALRSTPPARRGRAMGVLGLPVLVGPVLGPTLGGWLVDISWRWIFLVNLPVGLLAVIFALRVLRRDRSQGHAPLDVAGLALIAPGLTLVVFGLAESGRRGTVASPAVVLPALAGFALCAVFVLHALWIPRPLIHLRLLRQRALASGTGTVALFAAAYFGSMFVLPLYWQLARGLSPAATGMLSIPQALSTGIALQVASRLVDRIAPARVVGVGITLAVAGLLTTALLLDADTPYWQVLVAMSVTGAGVGSTIMPTITTALRHLPDQDAPSGSTLLTISNQVSISIGTALTSVLLATSLAGVAVSGTEGALPTDVGPDLAEQIARACRDTLFVPVGLMATALVAALLLLPRGRGGRNDILRPAPTTARQSR